MRIKNIKRGFQKMTKMKARLIAHLIGDGCVFKSGTDYNIKYEVVDMSLINQFRKDLISVYGLIPTFGYNPSGKTGKLIPYVRLRSKKVYDDLLKYCLYDSRNWKIPKEIFQSDSLYQIEFLRALFDDEGSVIHYKTYIELRLYSINLKGLQQVKRLLKSFKINSKLVGGYGAARNVYGLKIKDIKLFYKKIRFNLERKQKKLENYFK